jgi:AcrR family transcriptional regulator
MATQKMATKAEPKAAAAGAPATSRGDERQQQLLAIAGRLFARRGFNGTSLRDIAEEAKITKAALYYHFPNKEALYEKIVLRGLEALLEQVMAATARETTAVGKVRAFMLTSAVYYTRHRDEWIAGSNAFRSIDDTSAARERALMFRDQYEKHLRNCIRGGVESGEFRKTIDPAMAGRVLLASFNGMSRWHHADGKLSAQEVVDEFLDIVLTGMRAQPGAA